MCIKFISWVLVAALGVPAALFGARQAWAGDAPLYEVDVVASQKEGKVVEGRVRGHTLLVDQPKPFGGTDAAATPPETLAFALGACIVSAVRFVAELEKLEVSNITARVTGTLDFSRAMGLSQDARPGFPGLSVIVGFDAPWSAAEKQSFLDRVIARCPVCDNFANATPLKVELKN